MKMKISQLLAPVVAGFLMSACSVSALLEEIASDLQAQALQEVSSTTPKPAGVAPSSSRPPTAPIWPLLAARSPALAS